MNQLKAVLIVVVCSLYVSATVAADCAKDGFFALEGDCSRYYQCVIGVRYDFECSAGLKFDTRASTCVWGNQLDCVAVDRPTTEAGPTTTKKPSPPTADCPMGDGHFVDDKDCSRFYVCSDGIRHYSNCDHGLHFDTVSKLCTWPKSAKCTN